VRRTPNRFGEHDYRSAKKQAAAQGISVAEYVGRAIRSALPPSGRPTWMRYAGLVKSGNPRSSRSIDEIVYGQKD
jgi:hypothetical protein